MKTFEFKSQICTTRSQSERLLNLGLKKETADMWYPHFASPYPIILTEGEDITDRDFPAWSLHRLLEMLYADIGECMIFFPNPYEEIIGDIENLIGRGTFNADYLEEKQ